jgi:glycine cleavage system H protein
VSVPTDLQYTRDHEWVRLEGDVATVGITQYAADQLGDIVFVELPDVGRDLDAAKAFGVVESVKAVSDLYAPIAGEVVEVNDGLTGAPELVNSDPYGAGWMIKVRLAADAAPPDLLEPGAYDDLVAAG